MKIVSYVGRFVPFFRKNNYEISSIYKRDPRVKDFLKEVVIKYNNAPAFVLSVTSQILPIAFDLHIILLQNNTNTKFITSDNPVVKYNQFLEHRNTVGSNVGLSTKGLQIFFPLTPDFCILFYDITVYKIGNRKQTVIIVSDTNDIDQLNKLQIINAYNNVFFNEQITKEYIEKLISQSKHYFRKETSRIKEIPLYQDSNGGRSLLVWQQEDIRMNLKLSFVKEKKKAKKYDVTKDFRNIRNEKLVRRVLSEKEYKNI